MTIRTRPIHSGFETLRIAGMPRSTKGYHHFGSATNEQLTALSLGQITRPTAVFADFRER
jgi:hypothetical protein